MKVKKIIKSLVLIIVSILANLNIALGTSIFEENFEGSILNPNWSIIYSNIIEGGWEYEISNSNLILKNISPKVINSQSGGIQSTVEMSQQIIPIDNFEIDFRLSWDSNDSNNVMNRIFVALYDENNDIIVKTGYMDAWVSHRGTKSVITRTDFKNFDGYDSLPHKGTLDFQIIRNNDIINVLCDNIQLTSISNDSCVFKLSLIFGHYPYKNDNISSTVGKVSVDFIKIDGELFNI